MISPLLQQVVRGEVSAPWTCTVERYHQMREIGILHDGDPFELIDGFIVPKDRRDHGREEMTIGPEHSAVVANLSSVLSQLIDLSTHHIRSQAPLTYLPKNEPEPDVVVVRGQPYDYCDHHPDHHDVDALFEVSSSSLPLDRTTKLQMYAAAGIRHYIIVNLVNRCCESFRLPHGNEAEAIYSEQTTIGSDATLTLIIGGREINLRVADIIPTTEHSTRRRTPGRK